MSYERKGHFRNMCRTKKKLVTGQHKKIGEVVMDGDNLETSTMELDKEYGGLMSVTTVKIIHKAKIPHMVYEQLRWIILSPQLSSKHQRVL